MLVPEIFYELETRNIVEPERVHNYEYNLVGFGWRRRQKTLSGIAGEMRVDFELHLKEEEQRDDEEKKEDLDPVKHSY